MRYYYRLESINGKEFDWYRYDRQMLLSTALLSMDNENISISFDTDVIVSIYISLLLQSGHRLDTGNVRENIFDYLGHLEDGGDISKGNSERLTLQIQELLCDRLGLPAKAPIYAHYVIIDMNRYVEYKASHSSTHEIKLSGYERYITGGDDMLLYYNQTTGEGLVVSANPISRLYDTGGITENVTISRTTEDGTWIVRRENIDGLTTDHIRF